MDVLTDVLRTVRLESVIYGRLELAAPWGIRLQEGNPPTFLVLSRGSCRLEVEGKEGEGETGKGRGYCVVARGFTISPSSLFPSAG